jgi:hypothetical protein
MLSELPRDVPRWAEDVSSVVAGWPAGLGISRGADMMSKSDKSVSDADMRNCSKDAWVRGGASRTRAGAGQPGH